MVHQESILCNVLSMSSIVQHISNSWHINTVDGWNCAPAKGCRKTWQILGSTSSRQLPTRIFAWNAWLSRGKDLRTSFLMGDLEVKRVVPGLVVDYIQSRVIYSKWGYIDILYPAYKYSNEQLPGMKKHTSLNSWSPRIVGKPLKLKLQTCGRLTFSSDDCKWNFDSSCVLLISEPVVSRNDHSRINWSFFKPKDTNFVGICIRDSWQHFAFTQINRPWILDLQMQTCLQTLRHFGKKNTLDKMCASTTSHQSIKDQRVPALHLLTFRLVETNLGDQPPPLAVIGVALWCCSSQNGAPQELQRKGRMGLSWNGKMITWVVFVMLCLSWTSCTTHLFQIPWWFFGWLLLRVTALRLCDFDV